MTGVNALPNSERLLDLWVKDKDRNVPTVGIESDTLGFVSNRFGIVSAASMDLSTVNIDEGVLNLGHSNDTDVVEKS